MELMTPLTRLTAAVPPGLSFAAPASPETVVDGAERPKAIRWGAR
jgi:hypothetical protein